MYQIKEVKFFLLILVLIHHNEFLIRCIIIVLIILERKLLKSTDHIYHVYLGHLSHVFIFRRIFSYLFLSKNTEGRFPIDLKSEISQLSYYRNPQYHQTQIVDKNRLQYNAFSKSMQKKLAKIANSWLTGPPIFSNF